MINILSIDGGGIRGVLPATILVEIEQRTNRPISSLFDLMAGTSTGGMLALALNKPGADGKPAFTAHDVLDIYVKHGEKIFPHSFFQSLSNPFGLFDEVYPSEGIESLLKEYFGDVPISKALTEELVTSYDVEGQQPWFFKSYRARLDPHYDYPMRLCARATSAAPTYFEPLQVMRGKESAALIDGGMFANNPGLCAFVEAKLMLARTAEGTRGIDEKPREIYQAESAVARDDDNRHIFMVSLGTGTLAAHIPFNKAKGWGVANWAKPIIDILMQGSSYTVDYQLQQLLPPTLAGQRGYYRFTAHINDTGVDSHMDNAKKENIDALLNMGKQVITQHDKEIDEVCKRLMQEAKK